MTDISTFIQDFHEAFGEKATLPILFYYSDTPVSFPEKTNGCMFKLLVKVKEGQDVTLSADTVTCGGGKHYAGFAPLPERVYTFVSEKERYKQTPQDVKEYVERLDVKLTDRKYLNFVRIDLLMGWRACFSSPHPICFQVWRHGRISTTTPKMPYLLLSVQDAHLSSAMRCVKTVWAVGGHLSGSSTLLYALMWKPTN